MLHFLIFQTMRMGGRLVRAIVILVAVIVLNFILIRIAPGDPATVLAGEAGSADQAIMEQVRHDFGLDRPIAEQLMIYMENVARFDFGQSYRQSRPVSEIILERLPATVLLTGAAFVMALILGVGFGVLAAVYVGTWVDRIISACALILFAVPVFWVGLMAILLFSVRLQLLPSFGMETFGSQFTVMGRAWDILQHLILPMTTLALFYTAMYTRLMRSSMLETQFEDYMKTARAKGAGPLRLLRHALRNAILPVVTMAGVQAGNILGGAILIETVFAWPGLGRLAVEAITQRDYNMLMGIFIVASALGLVLNILTDALCTVIDPRIEAAR